MALQTQMRTHLCKALSLVVTSLPSPSTPTVQLAQDRPTAHALPLLRRSGIAAGKPVRSQGMAEGGFPRRGNRGGIASIGPDSVLAGLRTCPDRKA